MTTNVRVQEFVIEELILVAWDGGGWRIGPRPMPNGQLGPLQGLRRFVAASSANDTDKAFAAAAELVALLAELRSAFQEWSRRQEQVELWFRG